MTFSNSTKASERALAGAAGTVLSTTAASSHAACSRPAGISGTDDGRHGVVGVLRLRCGHLLDRVNRTTEAARAGLEHAILHDEAAAHQGVDRQALHAAAVERRDPRQRLQLGVVDDPFAVEVDHGDVSLGAGLDHALARIEPPDLRRTSRAPAHVVRDAVAAGGDLGEHHRHLRLDAGKAAIDGPDVVPRLFLDRVRCMVGRNHIDSAVGQRRKQRLLVALLAHRRIDADDAAEAGIVVGRQKQVLRAGLAGDVDAARLGLAQRPQLFGRGDMQDVDAAAGPFGQDRGAAHRLDRHHRRPRGDMRERIDAARFAHPQLAADHDRIGLGMQRHALAGRRDHLERLQHRTGIRRRNRAEGVAHVELEADRGLGQFRRVRDGVLAEQRIEPEIDVGFLRCHLVLGREQFGRADRRDRVRHVEHGGDAAEGRGRRAARKVLLVRIARIAEVHVHIDRAGQHVHALGVERLARLRHRRVGTDRENQAVLDGDARLDDAVRRHHLAAADDEIGLHHGCLLTASPSRRRPEGRCR